MIVEQIYIDNNLRNFNYILVCEQTGQALAIDPFAADRVLATCQDKGYEITQILNTHEHWDHIGGNDEVVAKTGAKILAHSNGKGQIPHVDTALNAGDIIKIGKTVELEILDTPGHTFAHVCALSHTDTPCLFSGDTLFNAGCGNCHNGGDAGTLYQTFSEQLFKLPDNTQVYPGHDYITHNLKFSLNREPGNKAAAAMLEEVSHQDPHDAKITTLALEKTFNPFFRLNKREIIKVLQQQFKELPDQPSDRDVFLCLRELRNSW